MNNLIKLVMLSDIRMESECYSGIQVATIMAHYRKIFKSLFYCLESKENFPHNGTSSNLSPHHLPNTSLTFLGSTPMLLAFANHVMLTHLRS